MSTADFNEFLDGQFAAQDDGGAPPAVEAPAPAAAETPAPAIEAPVDLDAALEGDKFDRAYVERLRKEAAGYRSKAKTFEDAFDGYGDEDRAGLLNLARQLREDPRSAAQEMAAAAEAILKQYQEIPALDPTEDPEQEYMTVADYKRIQEESAVNAEVKAIAAEARELGYNPSQGDLDYRMLLMTAQNNTKTGSLKEAHAILEARNQAVVDKYLAAKTADAEGPRVPSDSAQIPGTAEPIKSFKDARSALENYIAAQRS